MASKPVLSWMMLGGGVLLVYAATKKTSPLTLISDTIQGQAGKPRTFASFTGSDSGSSSVGGTTAVSGNVGAALAFAEQHIGNSYVGGAIGPLAWDCSSFVQAALAKAGVTIPRTTFEQVKQGQPETYSDLRPGDLIFTKGLDESGNWVDYGHVLLYAGNGQVIEAANSHTGVIKTNVPLQSAVQAIRRYVA